MKFSGYWVYEEAGKVVLAKTEFDETELDPATNWRQAWQNQATDASVRGYVDTAEAMACAARMLALQAGLPISDADIASLLAVEPMVKDGKCALGSLEELRQLAVLNATLKTMNAS